MNDNLKLVLTNCKNLVDGLSGVGGGISYNPYDMLQLSNMISIELYKLEQAEKEKQVKEQDA
jgi:hypothetical protein